MKDRLIVAGAIAGAAAVGALIIVVLRFGIEDPSPPSLRDAPVAEIPGQLVYASDQNCLTTIAASGEGVAQEFCSPLLQRYGDLAWLDETTVILTNGDSATAYDLETQAVVPAPNGAGGFFERDGRAPSGDVATVDEKGRLRVFDGSTEVEITHFDTGGWRMRVILWSPDSEWILVSYGPPRQDRMELWIVSRDGRIAGTIADDVWGFAQVSWRIEGVGISPELTP